MKKNSFSYLSDHQRYRILEMIPGVLTWSTFIAAIMLSFLWPGGMLYFIILFDFYWLVRILYMQTYLLLAYRQMRIVSRADWMKECVALEGFTDIIHVVFLPFYHEEFTVIQQSLRALAHGTFPSHKLIVVVGGEERQREHAEKVHAAIQKEFGTVFYQLILTIHPKNRPGELPGKGANMHWMGRQAEKIISELNLRKEDLIVSAFDCDTTVHPQYFAYLSYTFLTHPNRHRTSYQPIPVFHNNIWRAPAIQRIASAGTTFWLMTEQLRPERLFTFSSHAMSWKALVDVGFWQNDIVTEDSRIFLQGLIEYDGDYHITPLFIPISMDVVEGNTWQEGLKNLYKQQRRWAWGVEHFPWMVWHFYGNKSIPWRKKFHYLFTVLEGMYSWATVPILITILGRLPLWVASETVRQTALAQNTPQILEGIMNAALIGLFLMGILSYRMLPPRPQNFPKWKIPTIFFQWVLFPISMTLFGSVPAIEAQTRLMLGKYLGFFVTPKKRK